MLLSTMGLVYFYFDIMNEESLPSKKKEASAEKSSLVENVSSSTKKKSPGKTLAIIGLVCGVIAFALFPPFFGIAGIILGSFAIRKGEKQLGWVAVSIAIAGMIIGIILGYLFAINSRTNI